MLCTGSIGHITPEWMLHSNLRLLCGNHFIIKQLKGKLSKKMCIRDSIHSGVMCPPNSDAEQRGLLLVVLRMPYGGH